MASLSSAGILALGLVVFFVAGGFERAAGWLGAE